MEERSSGNFEERANSRSGTQPLMRWFVMALVALVASQVMRLHQHQAPSWLLWDYAGRITALAVLAGSPSARNAAFRASKRRISLFETVLWIAGICLLDRFVELSRPLVNAAFPATVLGVYPHPTGWLRAFDLVFGLALVAVSEEIIFRRYVWQAFKPYLGDGTLAVLTTSVLFGAYHWWAGLGNVLSAAAVGLFLMLMLRRSGVLWPVILTHYLLDLNHFA